MQEEQRKMLKDGVKVKIKSKSACGCQGCKKWEGKIVTFKKISSLDRSQFDFYEREVTHLLVEDIEFIYSFLPEHLFEIE